MRSGRSRSVGSAPLLAVLALGCSAELDTFTADADTGSTHALVGVERRVSLDESEAARAGVLAGFVQVPADVDSRSLFELVGLTTQLPEVGRCRPRDSATHAPPVSSIGHVEFLEAGDVAVTTSDSRTALAPHAFPTVTELISGVVYTTRDRSAEPLPAGARYALSTSGSGSIPALSVERDAPGELEGITAGGVPLGELVELRASEPLDLTWGPGSADDLVLVEVSAGGGSATLCAFRDDAGAGSIPRDVVTPGSGRLTLHRVRTSEFSAPGISVGELRFDFAIAASVTFTE